ncbi:hypothetical protein [Spirosoma radiotolerans]|uniref:Uncharacterized protein n=1 Tax=Spirosoma radiotolerans TaxID=1379870 RepID=A0A0E4A164_9BACT|nr:hypothetical protein [Spirosoma radiotolerans]AKD58735.1 hypothetical protein SD10_22690 [Spirosoma radiotolerans]
MAVLTLDSIIQRIADLQAEMGLFPSFRHNPSIFYRRPDTNVFFTAVTVFTLQHIRSAASPESQQLIDHIASRAATAYPIFRNKDGLNTYNFWPTRPSQHFSNGYVFRHFEHFRIPDDIDDTAMVYLTAPPAPAERLWLKEKLSQHANGSQSQRIRNTYPEYRSLRAYSTWFGKHMGVDFDACALSNILYCIYQYDLPRNEHDTDSLAYLRSVVESGRYVAAPFQCAPHYARTSLIIYHLARLIAAFPIAELEPIRPRLIADTRSLLTTSQNRVEHLLLATSLHRLGEDVPKINLNGIEQDFATFHFFIAGLLTAYEQPWLRQFADRPLMQMRWQCEAHCWALVAEYVMMYDV